MVKSNKLKLSIIKRVLLVILLIIVSSVISLYVYQKNQRRFLSFSNSSIKENNITNNTSEFYIRLVDNYLNDDDLSSLYEINDAEDLLKKFNGELNERYDFYEITFQAFQSLNYLEIDDKFFKKYGRSKDTIKNQEIEIDGKRRYVSSLNTVQVNQKAYDKFLSDISKGRGFQSKDFLCNKFDEKNIPVILGYDYMDYYDIGDVFELNYLEMDMKMEVIGFFENNMVLHIDNIEYMLNTYICSPYFQIIAPPATDAERLFQLRYYLEKNQGFIQYLSPNTDGDISSETEVLKDQEEAVEKEAAQFGLDYSILMYPCRIIINNAN